MRAWIYTGGPILCDRLAALHPAAEDLCIAADAGYRHAAELGVEVQILIGDFDSIGAMPPVDAAPEVFRLPPEKDDTDTQLAVKMALSRGAEEIVIVGATGGRMDHGLSTLCILEELSDRGIPAILTDGQNRIRFLRNGTARVKKGDFRYFGVVAADREVRGVTIQGCKYPLENGTIRRAHQYAVSNEIVADEAVVTVTDGALFLIESDDA